MYFSFLWLLKFMILVIVLRDCWFVIFVLLRLLFCVGLFGVQLLVVYSPDVVGLWFGVCCCLRIWVWFIMVLFGCLLVVLLDYCGTACLFDWLFVFCLLFVWWFCFCWTWFVMLLVVGGLLSCLLMVLYGLLQWFGFDCRLNCLWLCWLVVSLALFGVWLLVFLVVVCLFVMVLCLVFSWLGLGCGLLLDVLLGGCC